MAAPDKMSAFCPVCQRELTGLRNLCPHVAVVTTSMNGRAIGMVCEQGKPVGVMDVDGLGLSVLTPIGTIEDSTVYFSPNPSVYLDALHESWLSGLPVDMTYPALWRRLGLEHEAWHE